MFKIRILNKTEIVTIKQGANFLFNLTGHPKSYIFHVTVSFVQKQTTKMEQL